jgi:protein TonB
MEVKKYPQVDLERLHNLFLEVGLVVALGITFAAFEWKSQAHKVSDLKKITFQEAEIELIPITRQEPVRPPEPPPPQKVVEILNLVSNDTEIEEELEIDDTEANQETMIDIKPAINMGREKEDTEDDSPVFFIVEEMPEFPGGEMALRQFIANAIKYPVIAQENGIQGKVYVSFVVGKDGQVSDAKVLRGVDPSLDKEAIRVVNSLPRWKPGKQQGKAVRVSFSVPISFVLQ